MRARATTPPSTEVRSPSQLSLRHSHLRDPEQLTQSFLSLSDTYGFLGTTHTEDVDEERELAILEAAKQRGHHPPAGLKWQTALIDSGDPCLFVCPGTHKRFRNADERRALVEEPNGPVGAVGTEVQVILRRGETVRPCIPASFPAAG